VALGYVGAMAVNALGVLLIFPLFHLARPSFGAFGGLKGHPALYAYWLVAAWLSAAIGEELQFRAFLWSRLERLFGGASPNGKRWAWIPALIGQAALFGLGHGYQGPAGLIVTGGVGLVLGGVYLAARRNLVACMVLHALIDTVSLTALFLMGAKALATGTPT
jgi:membrane protease YdiL (CAAX protease family)